MGKKLFGLVLLMVGIAIGFDTQVIPADSKVEAQLDPLTADAGLDRTVPGPGPVDVQFDGSGSTGDIVSYRWFNQWGNLRAEGVAPTFEVNFGHQVPQPGTTRTFTLVIEDEEGNTAEDDVTITLGEPEPDPVILYHNFPVIEEYHQGDAAEYAFNTFSLSGEDPDCCTPMSAIIGGLVVTDDSVRWYVRVSYNEYSTQLDEPAIECHRGTRLWPRRFDGTVDHLDSGCLGDPNDLVGLDYAHSMRITRYSGGAEFGNETTSTWTIEVEDSNGTYHLLGTIEFGFREDEPVQMRSDSGTSSCQEPNEDALGNRYPFSCSELGLEVDGDGPPEPGLVADAGANQTVPGPGPVSVLLDASGSTGDIVNYRWYNERDLAGMGKTVMLSVNFGSENSNPGATHTLTLEVEDSEGNTAKDEVVITLGEPGDSRDNLDFEGTTWGYDNTSTGTAQIIKAGIITNKGEKRWYISSSGGGLDGSHPIAEAECHEGTYWEAFGAEDELHPSEGCIGTPGTLIDTTSITVEVWLPDPQQDARVWVASFDGKRVATLTPPPVMGQLPYDFQLMWSEVTFSK